jgi:TPR repeat protein
MFAALEQLHGARVFLRVCNAQGAALVRIQLAPAAQRLRLRTLVPVYEMAMGHRQRLRGMGCGGRGKLALLMSQGGWGGGPVPRDCSALMDCIVRRVAAAQVAATPEALHAQAQAMRAAGDFAAAAALLQQAVGLGHVLSRAELADMLIDGREGVAMDRKRAFELVEEGTRLGCCHSQGVMALCYLFGFGCSKDGARSLALARASAGEGSKYGQRMLGWLYQKGEGGVAQDYAAAVAQYRLAAAQGYDEAQNHLGFMYHMGYGVAKDYAEALRWYKLAAAQGLGMALRNVGLYYEHGLSVAADRAEAIRWYKRAAAAGYSKAAAALKRLGA